MSEKFFFNFLELMFFYGTFVGNPFFLSYMYIYRKKTLTRAHTLLLYLKCVRLPENSGRIQIHVWIPWDDLYCVYTGKSKQFQICFYWCTIWLSYLSSSSSPYRCCWWEKVLKWCCFTEMLLFLLKWFCVVLLWDDIVFVVYSFFFLHFLPFTWRHVLDIIFIIYPDK